MTGKVASASWAPTEKTQRCRQPRESRAALTLGHCRLLVSQSACCPARTTHLPLPAASSGPLPSSCAAITACLPCGFSWRKRHHPHYLPPLHSRAAQPSPVQPTAPGLARPGWSSSAVARPLCLMVLHQPQRPQACPSWRDPLCITGCHWPAQPHRAPSDGAAELRNTLASLHQGRSQRRGAACQKRHSKAGTGSCRAEQKLSCPHEGNPCPPKNGAPPRPGGRPARGKQGSYSTSSLPPSQARLCPPFFWGGRAW